MTLLDDTIAFRGLCTETGTDKARHMRYEEAYARFLLPYRDLGRPTRLLEIGVKTGASLHLWARWFPNLILYGVDIDPAALRCATPQTRIFVGDQGDANFWRRVLPDMEIPLDIVVDDGSHQIRDQKSTFITLWPYVAQGGLYAIEDLHNSIPNSNQWRNPFREQTTVDWLFDQVTDGLQVFRYKQLPITRAFVGCACFVIKPTEGGDQRLLR